MNIATTRLYRPRSQSSEEEKKKSCKQISAPTGTTFDAGILNSHFSLLFETKILNGKKKEKKSKSLKRPTTYQASCVTPIWKPPGQGSSLAPLRTTFGTWLPPDPLKPP